MPAAAGDTIRRVTARAAGVIPVALAGITLADCGVPDLGSTAAVMTVSSSAFGNGQMPRAFTCHGAKISPPLSWSGAPAGTRGFAVVVDDSAAPVTPFIYWIVIDIGPAASYIPAGGLTAGARQAVNSAGSAAYDPPCLQDRPHSYRFTVYALNRALNLPAGTPLKTAWTAIAAAIGRGRTVATANP